MADVFVCKYLLVLVQFFFFFLVLRCDAAQFSTEGQATGLSYTQFFIALNWQRDL